jgi:hypothetical protein
MILPFQPLRYRLRGSISNKQIHPFDCKILHTIRSEIVLVYMRLHALISISSEYMNIIHTIRSEIDKYNMIYT